MPIEIMSLPPHTHTIGPHPRAVRETVEGRWRHCKNDQSHCIIIL